MSHEYFPGIRKIPFEGTGSKNPLAFHYYDAARIVCGRPMGEWFKFALAWWHSLGAASADPFGGQTRSYAWEKGSDPYCRARAQADAGFELMQKLGIGYFCFHDIDLIEDCDDIAEYEARLKDITDYLLEKMLVTGIRNLWGTANVFGHKRYMNGAGTNPQFDIVARAAVQIKNATMYSGAAVRAIIRSSTHRCKERKTISPDSCRQPVTTPAPKDSKARSSSSPSRWSPPSTSMMSMPKR